MSYNTATELPSKRRGRRPLGEKPQSKQERNAAYRAKLRELTPLQRAVHALPSHTTGFEGLDIYTPEEQAVADLIRFKIQELERMARSLHEDLVERIGQGAVLTGSKKAEVAEAMWTALHGTDTRVVLPPY